MMGSRGGGGGGIGGIGGGIGGGPKFSRIRVRKPAKSVFIAAIKSGAKLNPARFTPKTAWAAEPSAAPA